MNDMSCHARDPREVALRERRDDYAAVWTAYNTRQAVARHQLIAALDQVTDAYRARVAIVPKEGRAS
jgi:hypothetical protein